MSLDSVTSVLIRNRARKIQAELHNQAVDYFESCARDRAEGFAPQYCIHGVSMWVDYDCACFRCEDGDWDAYTLRDFPFTRAAEMARDEWNSVTEAFRKLYERMESFTQIGLENGVPREEITRVTKIYFQQDNEKLTERFMAFA